MDINDVYKSKDVPFKIQARHFAVLACIISVSCATLVGCLQTSPLATGGDTPVTTVRLAGSRLTDIGEPLSWSFTDSTVIIGCDGKPIPSDVVTALLGDGSTPAHIEASWRLDEATGTLRLIVVKSDQTNMDKEVAVPIAPAGHVRLNLGSRQYNLSRERANLP